VDLHFAPTAAARRNLLAEGVPEASILVTGNTVIDALLAELERQKEPDVDAAIRQELCRALGAPLSARPFVLITGHRRENFGDGFEAICRAIAELAGRVPDHDFIYPVHLNHNVQAPVHAHLAGLANVRLIAPLAYSEFIALLSRCRLVLTDSGGVQEEAPSLGKPVLVMRDTTEQGLTAANLIGLESSKPHS
jgi:UDP-N-acetylglucosamine 2-epimerase (non-hydrolysing)